MVTGFGDTLVTEVKKQVPDEEYCVALEAEGNAVRVERLARSDSISAQVKDPARQLEQTPAPNLLLPWGEKYPQIATIEDNLRLSSSWATRTSDTSRYLRKRGGKSTTHLLSFDLVSYGSNTETIRLHSTRHRPALAA